MFSRAGPSSLAIRTFSTTSRRSSFHFDTHKFVERLQQEGLTRKQSEGIMSALAEVIDESVTNMSEGMVSKSEQEKQLYAQQVSLSTLKSELALLSTSDSNLLRSENERLLGEVEKIKMRLKEEITRTQAGVRLDLNLEKGRIRDESSQHELKIKEVDTRIESEIAGLRTHMQSSRFGTIQWLGSIAIGGGALALAYMRLVM